MPTARRSKWLELFWRAHQWLYRSSGGRLGTRLFGTPVLLLTTVGRKTGQPRTTLLFSFRDGENFVVVGSNAGEPRHPAWYHNLMSNPEAVVQNGTAQLRVRARESTGEERERLWSRIVEWNRDYADYQAQTDRRLPVVVLEPSPED